MNQPLATEQITSLDKNEWFDVYRIFHPNADRAELDREWDKFQHEKAEHEKRKRRN